MTSTPELRQGLPIHAKQTASSAPPVDISSQAHLDPACYVKGNHLLTIEAGTILHPRCRLYTDRGKVTVQSGSVLLERCIIGIDKELSPAREKVSPKDEVDSMDITIGPRAYLQSSVKLQPPCSIGEDAILESGVVLQIGCAIGAHSKICAGVNLPPHTTISDWTVVYGHNGQMRRKRQRNLAEDSRIDGINRERQGMEALLKTNATKTLSSAGGGSKTNRQSVIRTDSQKAET